MTAATLDRTEWLEWRRRGIGASDVAAIGGSSPWASPWSVWARKVGLVGDDDIAPTAEMEFGLVVEPAIVELFRRRTGLDVVGAQQRCMHATHRWARATVDGFVVESVALGVDGALGVFESKYDSGQPWDVVPGHYWTQCQWQMFVTDTSAAWLAVLHMAFGRPDFRVYELTRDDTAIGHLRRECEHFWRAYVLTGDMPPTDGHPSTTAAIRRAFDHVEPDTFVDLTADTEQSVLILRSLREQRRELDDEIREYENAIAVVLGEHTEGVVGGDTIVTYRQQSRRDIDAKRLREELPEIAAAYERTSTYRVMRLPGGTSKR